MDDSNALNHLLLLLLLLLCLCVCCCCCCCSASVFVTLHQVWQVWCPTPSHAMVAHVTQLIKHCSGKPDPSCVFVINLGLHWSNIVKEIPLTKSVDQISCPNQLTKFGQPCPVVATVRCLILTRSALVCLSHHHNHHLLAKAVTTSAVLHNVCLKIQSKTTFLQTFANHLANRQLFSSDQCAVQNTARRI